jgi:hypothetical protein
MAQPNSFSRLSLYPTGPTPGYFRLFEVRANGNNHVAFQAADAIASDCTYRISEALFQPCFHNQIDLGTNAVRFKKLWSQDVETAALTVGGAAGFSGNISFSGTMTPLFSGLGSLGTASLPYGTVNGLNVVAQTTFRLGSSATAGRVLTADASGFGTWQAIAAVTSINGMTNAAQTISIGAAGASPNITSSGGTVTVNIPQASLSAEGTITAGTQTIGGAKTFFNNVIMSSNLTVNGSSTTVQGLTVSGAAGFSGNISFSGTATPLFDSLGSIGTSSLRYGDFFGYRGNYASTLQASGLASLLGGLNVTGTTTLTGSLQFDVDALRNIGSSLIRANQVWMNQSRAAAYYYNGNIGLTGTVNISGCALTFTAGGLTGATGAC